MKCLRDGELPAGRKAEACGPYLASRFIRQKATELLYLLTLAICELGKGGFFMKKSIQVLTLTAMLTAMSVIIGMFCKNYMNFANGLFRVTFENLPIILSGILFGPITGAAVGAASDVISYLLTPQAYPINLVVTLGAATVGFVSGFVAKVIIKKSGYAQIIISGAAAHLIGSLIIKSAGLYQFYGWAIMWRIPLYILIASVELWLLCLLYKNATFRKLIDRNKTN